LAHIPARLPIYRTNSTVYSGDDATSVRRQIHMHFREHIIYEETGHQDIMFRMDMSTRREVIEIAESQSQGGLDRGGMWEMARAMADQEKSLKKSKHSGPSVPVGIEPPQTPERGGRRRRLK
jgi:hypothetical protein